MNTGIGTVRIARRCVGAGTAIVLAAIACQNDYDAFEFGTNAPKDAGVDRKQEAAAGAGGEAGASGAAGAPPVDAGSEGGSGGAAGGPCDRGELFCSNQCVSAASRQHCGGCNNDCEGQGRGTGFQCFSGACQCTQSAHCGSGSCTPEGLCECNGTVCNQGEACGPGDACSCNGGLGCAAGRACCETPPGCFDLQNNDEHCGGCGIRCPAGQSCTDGECG